jgi:hypothetical protein
MNFGSTGAQASWLAMSAERELSEQPRRLRSSPVVLAADCYLNVSFGDFDDHYYKNFA